MAHKCRFISFEAALDHTTFCGLLSSTKKAGSELEPVSAYPFAFLLFEDLFVLVVAVLEHRVVIVRDDVTLSAEDPAPPTVESETDYRQPDGRDQNQEFYPL